MHVAATLWSSLLCSLYETSEFECDAASFEHLLLNVCFEQLLCGAARRKRFAKMSLPTFKKRMSLKQKRFIENNGVGCHICGNTLFSEAMKRESIPMARPLLNIFQLSLHLRNYMNVDEVLAVDSNESGTTGLANTGTFFLAINSGIRPACTMKQYFVDVECIRVTFFFFHVSRPVVGRERIRNLSNYLHRMKLFRYFSVAYTNTEALYSSLDSAERERGSPGCLSDV